MGFRDVCPPAIQEIIQNGLLDGVFDHALEPALLFENVAELRPWSGGKGATSIMTRDGLMPVNTSPITGNDASAGTYGFEQFKLTMDQFGFSVDTNMAVSALAMASKFLEDNNRLGVNAAQTLNALAQETLYAAFGTGQTYATAATSASTSLHVEAADGFTQAPQQSGNSGSNGAEGLLGVSVPVLNPVSAANPLSITVGGVANTVTGVAFDSGNSGPGTLTLGTAISAAQYADVISSVASYVARPNARATGNDLVAGDIATLQTFQSAVTRLRTQNVPRIRGAYVAHVHPETVEELFQDAAFQRAYTGRAESPAYSNFSVGADVGGDVEFMGRFLGIDWFMNNLVPTAVTSGGVTYYRDIVCGEQCLIKGPFDGMGDLMALQNAANGVSEVRMVQGVARIWRAPLDRLGQIYSSTWSWIGGWAVGTDMLTGDSALYKRACVVEHA